MIHKLSAAPLVVLACTVLLAGCGSSSSSSTKTGSSTSSGASTGSGATKVSGAAVDECKHEVKVLPTLSQKTKDRLESICEKAASGDAAAARTAAREGCEEIVKASPVPAGVARDQALAGCKAAEKK